MEPKKASQLQSKEYILVMDTQEINHILDYIKSDVYYPCLIVRIENGDYAEIWGTDTPPFLENFADRLL